MLRSFAIVLFIFVSLHSCKRKEDKQYGEIIGSWRLSGELIQDQKNNFETDLKLSETVRNGSLLSFFPDSCFTLVSGEGIFETGKWSTEADGVMKLLRFESEDKPVLCHVQTIGAGADRLSLIRNDISTHYVKEGFSLDLYNEDPFHPANNSWRRKPEKKETYRELVKRVAGYCKHVALLLKAGIDRKQQVFDFGFSQGPINIYQNAIGIYEYEIVPQYWKNCFYNEADASSAYFVYKSALAASRFRGAASNTWMESDYKILLSIYATLMKMQDFNYADAQ